MDGIPNHPRSLGERITDLLQWGVRVVTRLAIAFGLSTAAAIGLGVAVTDNAFVQIIVIVLAALAFWIPFAFLVAGAERLFKRRRSPRSEPAAAAPDRRSSGSPVAQESWRRLATVAPAHSERLTVLRRSLEKSRLALGKADLDPDAHDLCVLIDRRLPDLIHRELDTLPPDDRSRRLQIDELVGLIEQFARHCSRRRSGDEEASKHEAAVLRRRFEEHLSGPGTLSQLD